MAIGEASGVNTPRTDEQEPAYEGIVGRTRLKSVHVTLPSGFVRLVQVYDRLNVGTDPHLRDSAIAGALHRFEGGEALAVPFVYHDPQLRKLALVVPEMLRHQEHELRSKLLADLAEDRESPIPSYVAEARTVVGISNLGAYLESKHSGIARREFEHREADLKRRETELHRRDAEVQLGREKLEESKANIAVRMDALTQREGRLHSRAEEVTRREDELRLYSEELDAARADLGMREQELESRMEMLHEREEDLASRSGSEKLPEEPKSAGDSEAVQIVDADEVDELLDDDEIEELDEVEPLERLETSPGEHVEDLAKAVELVGESLDRAEDEAIADDVEEIVDDVDDLEEVREVEDVTGLHAIVDEDETIEPLRSSPTQVSALKRARTEPPPRFRSDEATGLTPSVAPPPDFFEPRGAEAIAAVHDGAVRVFAKLRAEREGCFAEGREPDLLVQLVVVEECPVVLLTLVETVEEGRPHVVRVPVDPKSEDGRAILEALRRRFSARVVLFTTAGTYLRAVDASGPRETNMLRILDRVGKMRTAAAVEVSTATDRILSAPPPTSAKGHPFSADDERPETMTAAEAKAALDAIESWSSHDKMDHAILVLSIPSDQVDSATRHVLDQAVAYGLPLSGRLQERAVALGVADDPAALVTAQIEAFSKTTLPSDRSGLSPEAVAAGWEALLESAAEAEVALDASTHELAWKQIRIVRGGDSKDIDPKKLPEMGIPELVMLLEHPRYRCDAAIELASRGDPELAARLCKAVRKMPRSEVVRVVPRIVELGDGAGDAVIDGLGARKTFVRQAFALTLGQLKLRRAVVPLLHLLGSEESGVWREVARVIGMFGTASVRTVTRQLKDPKGPQERYIATLAHLSNHGCEKQVEKLTKDDRPSVAAMAVEALTLRQMAKTANQRAVGKMPLDKKDPILEFSRRFYAELEGRASDEALED